MMIKIVQGGKAASDYIIIHIIYSRKHKIK